MADLKLDYYSQRLKFLEEERQDWELHWQEITDYLLPRHGIWIATKGTLPNEGEKKHSKIIDGTGTRALRVLAAGMQGGLTSPARPWFRLSLEEKGLAEYGEVKNWLYNTERKMYSVFAKSNFYDAIHAVYLEQGGFGTACLYEEEDPDFVVRFRLMTAGEYCLDVGANGRVDTMYRRYWQTARNIVDKFGEDNVPDEVRKMVENDMEGEWFQVCHAIQPRDSYDPTKRDAKNMPFISCYWIHEQLESPMRESGYVEFPSFTPRWMTVASDVYGRSPGMDVLGDIKMLQEMQKASIKGIHKMVDPPVVVPTSYQGKLEGLPGGVNKYDGNREQIGALYDINFRVDQAEAKIERVQVAIREGLYNDLFLMLMERPNMTATEILERHEEKLLMLGPVIERQFHELLDPVIDRTFGIMYRNGMIDEPPRIIQGMPLKVDYISLLAQAQKLVATQSIQAGIGFVARLAEAKQDISVWDKVDTDQAIDEYSESVGLPPTIILPDDAVKQIRARRQAEIERQRQLEEMQAQAAAAKDLGQASTEEDTALGQLKRTYEAGGVA